MTGNQLNNLLEIKKKADKNFSKKIFADALKISQQSLNKKFKSRDLGSEFVKQVADYFNMTVVELESFGTDISDNLKEPDIPYGKMSLQDKYNRCLDDKSDLLDKLTEAQKTINELNQKIFELQRGK